MFDELDFNALGVGIVTCLLAIIAVFRDPLGMGMKDLSIGLRLAVVFGGLVIGYVIAARMLDN